MPIMHVSGTKLHYEEYGSGDEIVLSAQNLFFSGCYQAELAKPPTNCHVYAITLRGYGASEHVVDDQPRDWYQLWMEDILAFAQAIGAERFIYTGNSHGSVAGWYLARHHPEVLKGLISVSGTPHTRKLAGAFSAGRARILAQDDPTALEAAAWNATHPTSDAFRLERRMLCRREHIAHLRTMSADEFLINPGLMFPEAATDEQLATLLSTLTVPTLIINAMLDHLSTPEVTLAVGRALPGSKTVFFQNFEHSLADERPDLVNHEIGLFIEQLNARVFGS